MEIKFVEANKEYADYIADHLKATDYIEVVGLTGRDTRRAVASCVRCSEWSRVCLIDNEPAVIFGVEVTDPINNVGCIWMLTTELTQKHKLFIGRETKKYIRKFMEHYTMLFNYVDNGNDFTLRWLRFLGAKIYDPEPAGIYGFLYRRFEFTKAGVAHRYTKSERWCE